MECLFAKDNSETGGCSPMQMNSLIWVAWGDLRDCGDKANVALWIISALQIRSQSSAGSASTAPFPHLTLLGRPGPESEELTVCL
jgi:hypothetical protein